MAMTTIGQPIGVADQQVINTQQQIGDPSEPDSRNGNSGVNVQDDNDQNNGKGSKAGEANNIGIHTKNKYEILSEVEESDEYKADTIRASIQVLNVNDGENGEQRKHAAMVKKNEKSDMTPKTKEKIVQLIDDTQDQENHPGHSQQLNRSLEKFDDNKEGNSN
ncbi:hypothetical protein K7X08_027814 [Anisodus acutangulus]|uniref:Uncharacterized protein n=1 Tax=Anisodus acutangulus TaxID=402998 RepID=A0A9Q1LJU4_9SOLA|nr:hypothetical protein K7X08_027814 [Anisodus acutangulus]